VKTMLHLPDRMEIQLTDVSGQPLGIANVLLAIRFFFADRYYYGDLLPLTDNNGVTVADREGVRARFEDNRRLFPMDYSVQLESCDQAIRLAVLDTRTIQDRLKTAPENAMISADAHALYAQAQNQRVLATEAHIELPSTYSRVMTVPLAVRVATA